MLILVNLYIFLYHKYNIMDKNEYGRMYYYSRKNDEEFMENRRQYAKMYYEKNKKKMLEYQKKKRAEYKQTKEQREKHNNYTKQYYKKNRIKLLERQRTSRNLGKFYDIKTYKNEDRNIKFKQGNFTISFK